MPSWSAKEAPSAPDPTGEAWLVERFRAALLRLAGVPFEPVWTSRKLAVPLEPIPGLKVDGWRILAPNAAAIAAAWKERTDG